MTGLSAGECLAPAAALTRLTPGQRQVLPPHWSKALEFFRQGSQDRSLLRHEAHSRGCEHVDHRNDLRNDFRTPSEKQTLGFQAEVRDLLKLMIHSLYSHRSDANDRLRFAAIADPSLLSEGADLEIKIDADSKAGTVTIRDNGIGMTREDAIANLGTIARSGTAEFFKSLSGDQQKDSALIGQFGVGFYSAFIVADRVEVVSRRAGAAPESGVRWESSADGDFTVETVAQADRGTTVTLHLKADAKEFADGYRLRSLIRKYSDHIGFPVRMRKEGEASLDYELVNEAKALWTLPRTDIKDEEYKQFYQHIGHDYTDPLAWSHNKVEGKREYTSLLYVPGRAPFDLWQRDAARGLKLYVRRVFIMDDAEQFLPQYLRFVKGIVDSSDLPLNVSRELLQQDPEVDAIRGGLTKRVLDMLARLMKDEPEKYATFWKEFGAVLKEGLAQDMPTRTKSCRCCVSPAPTKLETSLRRASRSTWSA